MKNMNFAGKFGLFLSTICCVIITLSADTNVRREEKKSKSVTTILSAKWEATPIVMELAEYLSGESPDLFWSFIEGINSLKVSLEDLGKFYIFIVLAYNP